MRTNIVIDDLLLAEAMRAGPFKTKKDAVEAGLKLLARHYWDYLGWKDPFATKRATERQVAYREILKWEGRLKWEGDERIDWTKPAVSPKPVSPEVPEPAPRRRRAGR